MPRPRFLGLLRRESLFENDSYLIDVSLCSVPGGGAGIGTVRWVDPKKRVMGLEPTTFTLAT